MKQELEELIQTCVLHPMMKQDLKFDFIDKVSQNWTRGWGVWDAHKWLDLGLHPQEITSNLYPKLEIEHFTVDIRWVNSLEA